MERDSHALLTPREGRKFAFTVGTAFVVLGGLLYWWRDHGTIAGILGGVGVSLIVAGVLVPSRLSPVWRAWMGLALILSKVTTPIFMSAVYYLVLTPTGVARRVLGQNPIRHSPLEDSYWAARPDEQRRSNLQRQF